MSAAIRRYLNLRTALVVGTYAVILIGAFLLAYALRFDFRIPEQHLSDMFDEVGWVVLTQLLFLAAFRQLDCILAYFRLPDAALLFFALAGSAAVFLGLWFVFEGRGIPPRSTILIDLQLAFLGLAGLRTWLRVRASSGLRDWLGHRDADDVLIVGAGEVGASLCAELLHKPRLGLRPIAFLDDDPKKVGRLIHNVPVVDTTDHLARVAQRYGLSRVIVAMPSASIGRVRALAEAAGAAGLSVETVPALADLASGRARATQLRPIKLEDLLGREAVDLDSDEIRRMLAGRRVLVTGAGGSIGSELARQIAPYGPSELALIDHSEIAIFELDRGAFAARGGAGRVRKEIVDICDEAGVRRVFEEHRPEIVFHAAAHKHVALMEGQPAEALRNNFFPAARLADRAIEFGVERFILISSDKAVHPTSVMGATKRLAELAVAARARSPGHGVAFMAVRFGNVLGSSGSVVPVFRRQIEAGGPVTVRHPEVTRFFMTAGEAAGLVLQSAALGKGGEIFVLDMGEPAKIVDIARQMIRLSGLEPEADVGIEFTGLRPGEKLREEYQHRSESLEPTPHPRVLCFRADAEGPDPDAMERDLAEAMAWRDPASVKERIRRYVPEYGACDANGEAPAGTGG